jgi:DsbC/DsbD-like thiol-disulfide interchange protein
MTDCAAHRLAAPPRKPSRRPSDSVAFFVRAALYNGAENAQFHGDSIMARHALAFCSFLGAALAAGSTFLPAQAGGKRSDAEVKVAVESAKPAADGKLVITLALDINKGWHIYGNPVGNDDLVDAQTVVSVSGKTKPTSVKIDYPKGHVIKDKTLGTYNVYEDKVTIKATVERAAGDSGPLDVTIRFQACNESTCLFPATKKLTVP